jgi:hypothetical protein
MNSPKSASIYIHRVVESGQRASKAKDVPPFMPFEIPLDRMLLRGRISLIRRCGFRDGVFKLIDLITVKHTASPRARLPGFFILSASLSEEQDRQSAIARLPFLSRDISLRQHGGVIDPKDTRRIAHKYFANAAASFVACFSHSRDIIAFPTRGNGVICIPICETDLAPFDLLSAITVKIPRGAILITVRR